MKRILLTVICILGIIGGLFVIGRTYYGSPEHAKQFFTKLLLEADIKVNGTRPWDITIHNPALFQRVLQEGSLGLGEAYMDGWWDVERLDEFFYKICKADLDKKISKNWSDIIDAVMLKFFNYQTKELSKVVGKQHYDLSNEFFKAMLDKRMIYTCGYWKNAKNLEEAQEHKLDLICRKLDLKPGMTVLDIGCGWGGFALFAAEKYGAHVTGVTISKEQYEFAQAHKGSLPVTFLMKDYRDCTTLYDRVLSIGMFEHVGNKNYREYMEVVDKCLKDDGLSLLHTIGSNVTKLAPDPWFAKYIFPNSILPSLPQITEAANGLFIIEDIHNFGPDYDKTLMAWHKNFIKAWPQFEDKLGERFYRMWNYYLLSCAGAFRARGLQLWQVIMSKNGVEGCYQSLR